MTTTDILFETISDAKQNQLGKIILNRPQALNAMSMDMFLQLHNQLMAWAKDDAIKAVIVRSNNEKAFCAGGDIRAMYEHQSESPDVLAQYFRLEYNVNRLIYHYPKPYIALMNGITMGGGVGISIHASHRVAGSDLRFAMPETQIGFFPDVGATYHLSRLPNHVGSYLALTGNVICASNALALKLVDAVVANDQFDTLEKEIVSVMCDAKKIKSVIDAHQVVNDSHKMLPADKINACFAHTTVEAILTALESENSEWSNTLLSQLHLRSPTSLKVSLQQLLCAKQKAFDEVIEMDFHIARIMLENHDFYEGIRAAIIDKDKNPKWRPLHLSDVSEQDVAKYFSM